MPKKSNVKPIYAGIGIRPQMPEKIRAARPRDIDRVRMPHDMYVGMTNNLARRVAEHREGLVPGFTRRYGVKQLAYFEDFQSAREAIEREKQIKGWRREKKIALIESFNPRWDDLQVAF